MHAVRLAQEPDTLTVISRLEKDTVKPHSRHYVEHEA